jgi:hypothetical protein
MKHVYLRGLRLVPEWDFSYEGGELHLKVKAMRGDLITIDAFEGGKVTSETFILSQNCSPGSVPIVRPFQPTPPVSEPLFLPKSEDPYKLILELPDLV